MVEFNSFFFFWLRIRPSLQHRTLGDNTVEDHFRCLLHLENSLSVSSLYFLLSLFPYLSAFDSAFLFLHNLLHIYMYVSSSSLKKDFILSTSLLVISEKLILISLWIFQCCKLFSGEVFGCYGGKGFLSIPKKKILELEIAVFRLMIS